VPWQKPQLAEKIFCPRSTAEGSGTARLMSMLPRGRAGAEGGAGAWAASDAAVKRNKAASFFMPRDILSLSAAGVHGSHGGETGCLMRIDDLLDAKLYL
jgi:hypothetical protein